MPCQSRMDISFPLEKTDDIRAMAGASTKVIDAAGHTVLPGFIDSHVHLFGGSAELDYLDLYGVKGIDQLTDKVREWEKSCPDDEYRLCHSS